MSGFAILRLLVLLLGAVALVGGWLWFCQGRDAYNGGVALFGVIVFWVGVSLSGLSALIWLISAGDGVTCKNQVMQMGLQYRYSVSTPCMVYDHGRWIDIDQVLNNQEAGS